MRFYKKGVSILQVFLTEENKLDYHQILFLKKMLSVK